MFGRELLSDSKCFSPYDLSAKICLARTVCCVYQLLSEAPMENIILVLFREYNEFHQGPAGEHSTLEQGFRALSMFRLFVWLFARLTSFRFYQRKLSLVNEKMSLCFVSPLLHKTERPVPFFS